MNSPSPDIGLVDGFFLMSAEFEERFALLTGEERKKVERYLRVLLRDIASYILANAQGWLPELLVERPSLINIGDVLIGRRSNTVTAVFEDFSISFAVRRHPVRVVSLTLLRNCNG